LIKTNYDNTKFYIIVHFALKIISGAYPRSCLALHIPLIPSVASAHKEICSVFSNGTLLSDPVNNSLGRSLLHHFQDHSDRGSVFIIIWPGANSVQYFCRHCAISDNSPTWRTIGHSIWLVLELESGHGIV
jgi:hypothetical protein